jgi:subtilisin family serine protease
MQFSPAGRSRRRDAGGKMGTPHDDAQSVLRASVNRDCIFWTLAVASSLILASFNSASAMDQQQASTLLRDPSRILLRNAQFDVRQGPPAMPREFSSMADDLESTHYWIVQLSGPMTVLARGRLETRGADVLSYIPNRAYLVRIDPQAVASLRKDSHVSWVGPYRPDYKLSPEIGTRTFTDPNRPVLPGELLLTVSIFEGENVDAVARAALDRGADVLDVNRNPATPRILARVQPGEERRLAGIEAVQWIEEAGEATLRNNITRWVAQSNVTDLVPVWNAGIHGEGQIIGHIDGGIDRNSCYFKDLDDNNPGPNHRKLVGYRGSFSGDTHGTHTGGTCAGLNISGDLVNAGIAYEARISHTKLNLISSLNLYAYFDSANAQGAQVHTNSWGDDGTTAYTNWCRDIDRFSHDREDDLVMFAVTNLNTLKTPENAKNVLAVGATRQAPLQEQHGSGGAGPTIDGRRKPEVYLPGIGIVSSTPGACNLGSLSGTSMACPAVTGTAALVRQYYEEGFYPLGLPNEDDGFVPSGALVKATLINASRDISGVAGYPSTREGWGRILLDDALYFASDSRSSFVKDVRNADGLETGEFDEYQLKLGNAEILRVTMVFTDQPATVGTLLAPINDLDLELEGPDGTYIGNVFASGNSILGGGPDVLNNVERVQLPAESFTGGSWTLRVRATSVPDGPQGYALHVSGIVSETGSPTDVGPNRIASDPGETTLVQNHPNPFVTSTSIRFAVARHEELTVSVFDIGGRRIRMLATGPFEPGEYTVSWDARDDRGERVSAGIYFARLEGLDIDDTRKMVLLQ